MTNRFMISVAALALIAGTGLANAQGMNRESGGAAGGSTMQHSSPGDSSAAPSKSESSGPAKSETTQPKGGMKSSQTEQKKSPGAMRNERAEDNVKGGSTSQRAEDRAKGNDTRQRAEENQKSGNMKAEGREGRTGTNAAENNKGMNERSHMTTGQAGAGAKLTTEQRTKITSVIHNQHVESMNNVTFPVSVGTRVPREGVRFLPLPAEVVSIYPRWRGYDYIVVHNRIVVIDPNTYEIVEIIES